MNFTREPIIETIISPKEGFKLLVRCSKQTGQEEYYVDAIEVVSFGHAFFYRSLEKPKCFLVPVTDYEVFEVKEARVVLKSAPVERTIKIGGGREASLKAPREAPVEEPAEAPSEGEPAPASEQSQHPRDKKRDRHRRRRGRRHDEREWVEKKPQETAAPEGAPEAEASVVEETIITSASFTNLFPPPPTLISETISRYSKKEVKGEPEAPTLQPMDEAAPKKEEGEGSSLSRSGTPDNFFSFGPHSDDDHFIR